MALAFVTDFCFRVAAGAVVVFAATATPPPAIELVAVPPLPTSAAPPRLEGAGGGAINVVSPSFASLIVFIIVFPGPNESEEAPSKEAEALGTNPCWDRFSIVSPQVFLVA